MIHIGAAFDLGDASTDKPEGWVVWARSETNDAIALLSPVVNKPLSNDAVPLETTFAGTGWLVPEVVIRIHERDFPRFRVIGTTRVFDSETAFSEHSIVEDAPEQLERLAARATQLQDAVHLGEETVKLVDCKVEEILPSKQTLRFVWGHDKRRKFEMKRSPVGWILSQSYASKDVKPDDLILSLDVGPVAITFQMAEQHGVAELNDEIAAIVARMFGAEFLLEPSEIASRTRSSISQGGVGGFIGWLFNLRPSTVAASLAIIGLSVALIIQGHNASQPHVVVTRLDAEPPSPIADTGPSSIADTRAISAKNSGGRNLLLVEIRSPSPEHSAVAVRKALSDAGGTVVLTKTGKHTFDVTSSGRLRQTADVEKWLGSIQPQRTELVKVRIRPTN
jgi:hypothetical protein